MRGKQHRARLRLEDKREMLFSFTQLVFSLNQAEDGAQLHGEQLQGRANVKEYGIKDMGREIKAGDDVSAWVTGSTAMENSLLKGSTVQKKVRSPLYEAKD